MKVPECLRAFYDRYMRSDKWRRRRLIKIANAGYRCEDCGKKMFDASKFQVHHKTYERLGRELDEDLSCKCRRCHRRVST